MTTAGRSGTNLAIVQTAMVRDLMQRLVVRDLTRQTDPEQAVAALFTSLWPKQVTLLNRYRSNPACACAKELAEVIAEDPALTARFRAGLMEIPAPDPVQSPYKVPPSTTLVAKNGVSIPPKQGQSWVGNIHTVPVASFDAEYRKLMHLIQTQKPVYNGLSTVPFGDSIKIVFW